MKSETKELIGFFICGLILSSLGYGALVLMFCM